MEIENFNWSVLFGGVGQLFLVYVVYSFQNRYKYLINELISLRSDLFRESSRLDRANLYIIRLQEINIVKSRGLQNEN